MRHIFNTNSKAILKVGTITLCLTLLFTFHSTPLNAAYCSLRKPITAINTLFPNSENHRSIVRPISQEIRERISNKLPFTLHFNEIGQHTLYVAQSANKTVGYVHARSELSTNGIIEIAWAINLDMTIKGFFFQRCRSPECSGALPLQLSQHLEGKSYSDLLEMMNNSYSELTPAMQLQYGTKSDLVLSVIRSALKTISVTQLGWANDINTINRQNFISTHFGTNTHIQLQPAQHLTKLTEIENNSILLPNNLKTYTLLQNEQVVGYLAETGWNQGRQQGETNWLFSSEGKVLGIQAPRKWPNEEIKTAFEEVVGKNFSSDTECATAVEYAAKQLYNGIILKHQPQ